MNPADEARSDNVWSVETARVGWFGTSKYELTVRVTHRPSCRTVSVTNETPTCSKHQLVKKAKAQIEEDLASTK